MKSYMIEIILSIFACLPFFFRLAISVFETIHNTKLKNATFSRKNLAGIFLPVFFNNQII